MKLYLYFYQATNGLGDLTILIFKKEKKQRVRGPGGGR